MTARLTGDVPATIWATMAATGHNHGLRIRVFGDQRSLEWQHEDPHHLTVQDLAGETRILTEGMSTLSKDASRLLEWVLAILRAFSRHSVTSTATSPMSSRHVATERQAISENCRFPPERMACSVCSSWKP